MHSGCAEEAIPIKRSLKEEPKTRTYPFQGTSMFVFGCSLIFVVTWSRIPNKLPPTCFYIELWTIINIQIWDGKKSLQWLQLLVMEIKYFICIWRFSRHERTTEWERKRWKWWLWFGWKHHNNITPHYLRHHFHWVGCSLTTSFRYENFC